MKRILISCFLFSVYLDASSQQQVVISGSIVDKESGEAISFAHVGLCGKAMGTVSNNEGNFEFKIAPYYLHDTICISALGYITYRNSVDSINLNHQLVIELQPHPSILQEVVISDKQITGRRVLEKAINRIGRNYPRDRFLLDGYYRDYLKKDEEYVSILEGILSVEDQGFSSDQAKTRVRLNQLRYNSNYPLIYRKYLHKSKEDTLKELLEGTTPYFWGNEFSNMLYHDPIRNRYENVPFVGLFNEFYNSNYQFDIAYYTYINDQEVYVIHFKPNEKFHYYHVNANGEIFIRVKDYAILKFNYNYYVNKLGKKRKWYELNVEYREYKNKMFLNYIAYVNYFKLFTGWEIARLHEYREFFVTDIKYGDFPQITDSEVMDKSIPLFKHNVPDNPDFWNNYNVILLEKPLKD